MTGDRSLAIALVLLAIALGFTTAAGVEDWQWEALIAAALVGVALARWRWALTAMTGLAGAGALLLLFVAFTPVTRSLVPPLVRADPAQGRHDIEAIVVLSAWLDADGHLNEPGDESDRELPAFAVAVLPVLETAKRLVRQRRPGEPA